MRVAFISNIGLSSRRFFNLGRPYVILPGMLLPNLLLYGIIALISGVFIF